MENKTMNFMEKGFKSFLIGVVGYALGAGIVGYNNLVKESELENHAYESAMKCYQPVGNGGALTASNRNITPKRAKMYETMQKAYEEIIKEGALTEVLDRRYLGMKLRTKNIELDNLEGIPRIPFSY